MIRTIEWTDDGVVMIDQRLLPTEEVYNTYRTVNEVADAIRTMVIRGAPAIGVAAAMGIALGMRNLDSKQELNSRFENICRILAETRPTARNLFWAIERMTRVFQDCREKPLAEIQEALAAEARKIHEEDIEINRRMGFHGQQLLDSGNTAALGYAEESGIPYELAMIRNHYVRRTFIEPTQSIRHFGVKVKHNAVQGVLQGKRVVLVDDSIVRGTTLLKLVTMLRNAGAREVHLRISAPPTVGRCHYGIDTPTWEELIAHEHSVEEIRRIIGADSLGYLSLEGLRRVSASLKRGFCDACFSGQYPVPYDDEEEPAPQLSLFHEVEGKESA